MDAAPARWPACRVGLLGPTVVGPDVTPLRRGQPKQRELLAFLALRAGGVVSHDELADAMWDGHPPRTYAHSIQLYVSSLRRDLAAMDSQVVIETAPGGYRLDVAPGDVDLHRFRRLVAEGLAACGRDEWTSALALLGEALQLWRGTPLADVAQRDFARREAALCASQRLDALEALAAAHLATGASHEAVRAAHEVVAADDLRERSVAHLMVALYRSGRPADALRAYEDLRRRLDEELGAHPSAELRHLHEQVLRHDGALGPRATPRGRGDDGQKTAVSRPAPDTPDGGKGRFRRSTAAALASAIAAAGGAAALGGVWANGEPEPSRTAVLIYHGDGEVNMLVESGFDRAVSEFGLVSKEVVTGNANAGLTVDEEASPGAIVLDFTIETDLAAAARRHPDVQFVAVDDGTRAEEPNLATVRFATHEPSYLAGMAAARTTRSMKVAFVGGVDYETIWPFEAGFVKGVRAADPDVRVLVRYLSKPPDYGGGFLDPDAGERLARRLYRRGVDVIFSAAGTSGLGVFEAATSMSSLKRQLWAIGVDSDQYDTIATLPGTVDVRGWRRHILTSVVLRFDRAVYGQVASWARGKFRAGLHRYDLANGGAELSLTGGHIDNLRAELEKARRAIAAGDLDVPCRPTRLDDHLNNEVDIDC